MSWGEREKNKNKRCLCLEKGLGSAPDLGALWKQAAMQALGGAAASLLKAGGGAVAGSLGEGLCRGLRAAELAPANEGQKRCPGNLWQTGSACSGSPRHRLWGKGGRGVLSEKPPNLDAGGWVTPSHPLLAVSSAEWPESMKKTVQPHQGNRPSTKRKALPRARRGPLSTSGYQGLSLYPGAHRSCCLCELSDFRKHLLLLPLTPAFPPALL